MRILDLGCGKNKFKAKENDTVVGADLLQLPDVDVIHNFEKFPWPYKTSKFDLIICSHVLEHLNDIAMTMEEIWRISKPDAIIKIISPYFANYRAYTDPSHKRFFTSESFDYFDLSTELARNWPVSTTARFMVIKKEVLFGRPFNMFGKYFNRILPFYEAFLAYLFPARQIYFELKAIKQGTISDVRR